MLYQSFWTGLLKGYSKDQPDDMKETCNEHHDDAVPCSLAFRLALVLINLSVSEKDILRKENDFVSQKWRKLYPKSLRLRPHH